MITNGKRLSAATLATCCALAVALAACGGSDGDDNGRPTAVVTAATTAVPGETVTLDGSGSSDPDGDALSYRWAQVSGPGVDLSAVSESQVSFVVPQVAGTLRFQLIVDDGESASAPAYAEIAIDDETPTADAGEDQVVLPGAQVTLDGSGSSDPNGDALSYSWTQKSGPTVQLSAADAASPTFTAPNSAGELVFALTVSDGENDSAADEVKVTVSERPVAEAGPRQAVHGGDTVTLDGSGSADPGGATLTYAWKQIVGPTVTLDDATAEQPTFTAPEEEVVLVFQLTVSNGEQTSDADSVQIDVAYDVPPVADAGGNRSVVNLQTLQLDGEAEDPEGDAVVDWRWEVIGTPPGASYQLTGDQAPTAYFTPMGKGDYTLTLAAKDDSGWGAPDTITVHAENNPPTADAGSAKSVVTTQTVTLDGSGNDLDGDGLSYSWSVTGSPQPNSFVLAQEQSASAQLTPLAKGVYTLQLVTHDGDDPSLPSTVQVTATNNQPTVDAGETIKVADLDPAQLAPDAVDPDGDPLSYSWSISSTVPPGLTGAFSDANIEAPTFTPDAVGEYTLELTVTDNDSAPVSDTVKVVVYLLPDEANNVFVATTGDDNGGSCGSKAAPCKNLSTAVAIAAATGKAVVMAGGDYTDYARSITLPAGVKVLGGFDPGNWDRDLAGQQTILRPGALVDEVGATLTDGWDNDCDGYIDNPSCSASFEVCDNKDNDCDGAIDAEDDEQSDCGDTFEPNETSGAAATLQANTLYRGMTIIRNTDVDWFKIDVTALPPASANWQLTMQLKCVSICPNTGAYAITVDVYKDGTAPANHVFQGTFAHGDTAPVRYAVDKAAATTGTYYVSVSTDWYSEASYQLELGFKEPLVAPGAAGSFHRGPSCRDAYVLGVLDAKPAFQPGDENVISGLTVYGHDDAVSGALPWPDWIEPGQSGPIVRSWGSTVYCQGCALTLEDSTLYESQIGRRDISAPGRDVSAALAINSPKAYPVELHRNAFHLGYTTRAVGLAAYDFDHLVVRDNSFTSAEAKVDPHVSELRLIWAYPHLHGTETHVIDRNRFDVDSSGSQSSCQAVHYDSISDYHLEHPFAPLFVTNNIFHLHGGCAAAVAGWFEASTSEEHPDLYIGNNSFFGPGNGTAVYSYHSHHGMSLIAMLNNYIEGFDYGYDATYYPALLSNNVFYQTPNCARTVYKTCDGAQCADCIADFFCETPNNCSGAAWVSSDNSVEQCPVQDAAGGDFHPLAGSPCIDRGDLGNIPATFPQTPAWFTWDHERNPRPVDDPNADCPPNMTCDTNDVGAYEKQ